jgi:hypothetical protein
MPVEKLLDDLHRSPGQMQGRLDPGPLGSLALAHVEVHARPTRIGIGARRQISTQRAYESARLDAPKNGGSLIGMTDQTEPHEVRRDPCPECLGDGFTKDPKAEDPNANCPVCGGRGWVPAPNFVDP